MWDCHSCDPGSNPGPGVQPSVRIPTSTTNIDDIISFNRETDTWSIVNQQEKENQNYSSDDKYKVALSFKNNYQMRDLYNRKKKLDYWIERIHKDLDINDKQDALKFFKIIRS